MTCAFESKIKFRLSRKAVCKKGLTEFRRNLRQHSLEPLVSNPPIVLPPSLSPEPEAQSLLSLGSSGVKREVRRFSFELKNNNRIPGPVSDPGNKFALMYMQKHRIAGGTPLAPTPAVGAPENRSVSISALNLGSSGSMMQALGNIKEENGPRVILAEETEAPAPAVSLRKPKSRRRKRKKPIDIARQGMSLRTLSTSIAPGGNHMEFVDDDDAVLPSRMTVTRGLTFDENSGHLEDSDGDESLDGDESVTSLLGIPRGKKSLEHIYDNENSKFSAVDFYPEKHQPEGTNVTRIDKTQRAHSTAVLPPIDNIPSLVNPYDNPIQVLAGCTNAREIERAERALTTNIKRK